TISDSAALGALFLAHCSAESVTIKKSRFEQDLVILQLAATYLFVDSCTGDRISVQDCQLKLGSVKNSEFGSAAAGALSLDESFLPTNTTSTEARLGTISAKEHILVDRCELGGAETVGPLRADEGVGLKRSTLTTRRAITAEGGTLD